MNSALQIASSVVWLLALYAAAGIVFALWFAFRRGAERLDQAARGSSLGFRCAIIPGAVALWPLLLNRVRRP
ncbi:MAG: hypothetical protein FJW40_04850 [Acidobacteria bacterium]|nr:hypothetical protein [Acidobacteriota bacterium]